MNYPISFQLLDDDGNIIETVQLDSDISLKLKDLYEESGKSEEDFFPEFFAEALRIFMDSNN